MRTIYLFFVAVAGLVLLAGCLEQSDKDLDTEASIVPEDLTHWELAGSFGGDAEPAGESGISQAEYAALGQMKPPVDARYKPGGFIQVAGVCATMNEVWVCDLGISRVQVFDFEGNHLRNYGSGIPIEGNLLTDEEFYIEQRDIHDRGDVWWEEQEGRLWISTLDTHFQASDVYVGDNGFYIADLVRTAAKTKARRLPGVTFIPFDDGSPANLHHNSHIVWPRYLAGGVENMLAVSEPEGNALWLLEPGEEQWQSKELTGDLSSFNQVVECRIGFKGSPEYETVRTRVNKAGVGLGEFNDIGGIALAFDKLIACDRMNNRLQVFEARRLTENRWGGIIRLVNKQTPGRKMRFDVPLDIDVAGNGVIYVLDEGRNEVGLLSPKFERIGGFGRTELAEPRAIDLSDDGRHCFITDGWGNKVWHYVLND